MSKSGSPVPRSGGFLDAGMLPDGLPLLVLQQEPADSQARLASDREQAAILRAVASDLFESRCVAVIVIPSLPPELADLVIREIARGLSKRRSALGIAVERLLRNRNDLERHRLALRQLATIVRSARDLVFGWDGFENAAERLGSQSPVPQAGRSSRERWADREVGWDLCLFARVRESGAGDIRLDETPT